MERRILLRTDQLRPLVIGSRYSPIQPVCLTNSDNAVDSNSADSFFLTVNYCKPRGNSMDGQQFSITVEQVSIEKSQVFFAIRNHKNSGKWCAGVRDVAPLGKVFLMEQCNGQESQLFYIDAIDYSNEMAEYKKNTLIM
ncbi:hypothetical protein TYRP_022094 [Tyrophagus putrescentiae]|nr:hypothetical protein TYRP_022094 [Tyrophagus putrescentiae]